MKKLSVAVLIPAVALMMLSCSVSKNIPEGRLLLDRVAIQMDSGTVNDEELYELVMQMPNHPKFGLRLHNLAGKDSSFVGKALRKIGEPPVIFSEQMMKKSTLEIAMKARNLGFLNATADATIDTIGKKARVKYHLKEGQPFRIQDYEIRMPNEKMTKIALGRRKPDREMGKIMSMDLIEREISRVSTRLLNSGYYGMSAQNLHFTADTTLAGKRVNLTMTAADTTDIHVYRIRNVNVYSGIDRTGRRIRTSDSVKLNNITVKYDKLTFLRPKIIAERVMILPEQVYSLRNETATIGMLKALDAVSSARIEYREEFLGDSAVLDCDIFIHPADNYSVKTSLSGTNKAGDAGIAFDIDYADKNLFNGAEQLDIKLKGAYEFVAATTDMGKRSNYFEAGIAPVLTFPKIHIPSVNRALKGKYNTQTRYILAFDLEERVEFQRNYFNFRWQFVWSQRNRILTHTFSPLDINYAFMPRMSDAFRHFLNTVAGPVTKFSYENIFTIGAAYSLTLTNQKRGRVKENLYTVRLNAESSGNLMALLFKMANRDKNIPKQTFNVLGNPFAQYVKADLTATQTIKLATNATLALNAIIGAAKPYGNSSILPFEKRYYAGGPNSVRGWNTRQLGPGAMQTTETGNIALHTGDLIAALSAEYRYRVINWLEPAIFIDCGNIWTIGEYADQPGGRFRIKNFARELALGVGAGLRFDLKFIILRIDAGKPLYDPARPDKQRLAIAKDHITMNWKIYPAIGYPF
ncbi:MAG: BamA/TamA family outer membrane protein [Dysgonamonadaceae bacterium]|jgi:hypothetical protein|nr:BamA/TamA family outer membrane protein [Dysgonamonadaceae bacterium]